MDCRETALAENKLQLGFHVSISMRVEGLMTREANKHGVMDFDIDLSLG